MEFIVFNQEGEILRTGSCPEEMLSVQAQPGEFAIEGSAKDLTQYVVDGVVYDYTQAEMAAKSTVPFGYKWKMPERVVVKDLADALIEANLAATAIALRNKLLAESDWTQLPDVHEGTTPLQWRVYRQGLRDVPQQEGFPNSIVWPEMPS